MDLFIETKEIYNKFYTKYKENSYIWLEQNASISLLRSFFMGWSYLSLRSVESYMNDILNYAEHEK